MVRNPMVLPVVLPMYTRPYSSLVTAGELTNTKTSTTQTVQQYSRQRSRYLYDIFICSYLSSSALTVQHDSSSVAAFSVARTAASCFTATGKWAWFICRIARMRIFCLLMMRSLRLVNRKHCSSGIIIILHVVEAHPACSVCSSPQSCCRCSCC